MELYIVVCEIENKKSLKRIYKTQEECREYLAKLQSEVEHARQNTYLFISHENDELVIEEVMEETPPRNVRRRYSIISGESDYVLNQMLGFMNASDSF